MTLLRFTPALLLVAALVLAAGCAGSPHSASGEFPGSQGTVSTSAPTLQTSVPVKCPPNEHQVYRVVQGESFTYHGISPGYGGQAVNVAVYSELVPPVPQSEPAGGNGSFSIVVDKERTRQDWENHGYNYSGQPTSPFDHICMYYATGVDCFDLLIVGNQTDINLPIKNDWIRINPVEDPVIPLNQRETYTGNFFVNGTTSLPPGAQLTVTMTSLCTLPCPKTPAAGRIGCCGGEYYKKTLSVMEDPCGFSTWSLLVNTTPDRIGMTTVNGVFGDTNAFLLSVSARDRTADDNLWDAAHIVVRVREEVT